MATYLTLNLIFIAAALIAAIWLHKGLRLSSWRRFLIGGLALLLMTAIFDNLIIISGIVAYNETTLLGAFVGRAPIEDFAYSLAALILIPAIWQKVHTK